MRVSLTTTGAAVLALGLGIYAVGWAFGAQGAFIIAASLIGAVAVAFLWLLPNMRVRLTYRIEPEAVSVGDQALAHIAVAPGSRRRIPALTIEDRVGDELVVHTLEPDSGGDGHGDDDRDGPGGGAGVSYPLPTGRRGVYEVGPARVRRRDPLGLWQRTQAFGHATVLFVYPRRYAIDPVAAGNRHELNGPNAAHASQGTIAFHSLREYRHGDDLRSVHWKTSARTGTLMVRQQADSSQPQTTVVLDTRASSYREDPDRFELAVEVAASVVTSAAALVLPVELRTTSGAHVIGEFLEVFAGVDTDADGALSLIEHDVRSSASDTLVYVTTSDAAAADRGAVTALAQRFDALTIVNVAGASAPYPAPGGSAAVINASDGREFVRMWNADWA